MLKQEDFYYKMLLIRKFEEKLFSLFEEGKLFGTTHGYIGQEANAVGIISNLKPGDTLFSNHRCHGHYLARTLDAKGLLAEIMGKETGLCGGIGGSQHIYSKNFYTNGVQGSYMSIVTGMALVEKMNKSNNIIVGFIGDGTMGEGNVYESLNLMNLLEVPCLVIVENNLYAQTTRLDQNLSGSIVKRFQAFDIQTEEVTTTDVFEINELANRIIEEVRVKRVPRCLIINTYRFCSHSKSDDYRDEDEIKEFRKNDPLLLFNGLLTGQVRQKIETRVLSEIETAVEDGVKAGFLNLEERLDEISRVN
jgi:TPP-dependent pyruvate/acetoin dehydrogenase alpha subunit